MFKRLNAFVGYLKFTIPWGRYVLIVVILMCIKSAVLICFIYLSEIDTVASSSRHEERFTRCYRGTRHH